MSKNWWEGMHPEDIAQVAILNSYKIQRRWDALMVARYRTNPNQQESDMDDHFIKVSKAMLTAMQTPEYRESGDQMIVWKYMARFLADQPSEQWPHWLKAMRDALATEIIPSGQDSRGCEGFTCIEDMERSDNRYVRGLAASMRALQESRDRRVAEILNEEQPL